MKNLQEYKKSIPERNRRMIEKLADIGIQTASVRFLQAQYDGTNDAKVTGPEWIDENKLLIVASGQSVGFIEFGTGIFYSEEHPKASEFGAIRGSFGKHNGLQRTWGYYGDPGTNGIEIKKKNGNTVVLTHGNPPARAMYEAGKEMRARIAEIAREVYK